MNEEYIIDVPATVLEFKKDSFVGREGETINYKTALCRVGGRVLKFPVDKAVDDLPTDTAIVLAVELQADDKLRVKARIVAVR